ncbi:beta-galactosidase [Jeotgalibaca ciconiae]|uniref:Beta-galactosidase n=1 Tax=Jeotgalibaca ciconiae TaxID=2496265 RepID=A0A3Q9BJJ6_9LACT|nr:beta-galactosidase [Jeotgalibaca ciconiae]AZP03856.1 beta-galactosidase [Jeotgalibaca ciconiae]
MKDYYYGACLYPEHWNKEVFIRDVQHMKQLNMNVTRIGEFIWSLLEPEEGKYDFQILIDSLNILKEYEMNVIVGIPTPTPPRWMTYKNDDRLVKNEFNQTLIHGSRQHVCTNNAFFRKKANQLASKIAEVIRDYDHIIGIQLDNEFKAHTDLCICDSCVKLWGKWLEREYKDIERLNDAWGTNIWSESYRSFEEVVPPATTPFLHNLSLKNAYRKFTEEQLVEFVGEQVEAIREHCIFPITHNSALGFNIDNYRIFDQLDFASFDTYASSDNYSAYTLNLDFWRNMKSNGDFMLLETSTSHGGHSNSYGIPHPENYLQTEVFLNYAAGSRTFNYWHFRRHRNGCEQPHSAVVTPVGEPDISYRDVKKAGSLFTEIKPLLEKSTFERPDVAVIYSDRAKRYFLNEPSKNYDYRSEMTKLYTSLLNKGITVDVIPEQNDFLKYNCIFVPYLHHVSEDLLEKITHFVNQGGTCIIGPMTGDRTEEHSWPSENGLSKLGKWLGINNFIQTEAKGIDIYGKAFGENEKLSGLSSFLTPPKNSNILGVGTSGITKNRVYSFEKSIEKGKVIYLGAVAEDLFSSIQWNRLIDTYLIKHNEQIELEIEVGIVKYIRKTVDGKTQIWMANMQADRKKYNLKNSHQIIWTNHKDNFSSNELNPFECRIIELDKEEIKLQT